MYFLYSLLLTLGFLVLLPRFLFDAARHGKYAAGFRQRLGRLPAFDLGGRPVIWLHCVSVGETQAARPLARALLEQYPSHSLVVSTTTLTGQRIARDIFREEAAAVIYFPFDWAWTVRRALNLVAPAIVVIMETELWPRFLRECRRRNVPVAVVNGRLSERSFRRYQFVRRFIRRVVGDLSLALMQTDSDAERIRLLGVPRERVHVSGNVKFDSREDACEQALTQALRDRFDFNAARPLIVAASTHAPEEQIVLEAFKLLRAAAPENRRLRLLIAPRHPERFNEVASLVESSGLSFARRSAPPTEHDRTCDVLLLDSIGELRAAYPLASMVFVGGSIAETGGHNILEPAAAAACTVTGAHTFNFTAIVKAFLEAGALVQLPALRESDAPAALAKVFAELLNDDERRRALGENARAVLERDRGATARTVEMLAPLFDSSSSSSALQSGPEGARSDAVNA